MNIEALKTDPVLKAMLVLDEGREAKPYKDNRGNWTGGIGHNFKAHGTPWSQISEWMKTGIPARTIEDWYSQDVEAAVGCCFKIFGTFASLPDEVQRVLVDMAFDLMYELQDWHDLKKNISESNWSAAAGDILRSLFARQDEPRCQRLAKRMQSVPPSK